MEGGSDSRSIQLSSPDEGNFADNVPLAAFKRVAMSGDSVYALLPSPF